MQGMLRNPAAIAVMALLLATLSLSLNAAETRKFKWSHTARLTLSETKSNPAPDYEYVQGTYIDPITSHTPGFDMIEARIYNQDETIAGNGKHRGFEIDVFKNGDTVMHRYEGTHKVTVKDGGAWEVHYEGVDEYIGGTGKYKDLKGRGKYKGHITPDGLHEDDEAELTF